MIGKFVIVRSRDQGVVCGVLVAVAGRQVHLRDARQIHGWNSGALTLFEAANDGLGEARISKPVEEILMLEACGVIPCTEKAERNLRQSRWNAPYSSSRS